MELILDRVTVQAADDESVHASVRVEHTERGRTTTGAPEDHSLRSARVLAARAELLAAAQVELNTVEEARAKEAKGDALPLSLAPVPPKPVVEVVDEAAVDPASGLAPSSGL